MMKKISIKLLLNKIQLVAVRFPFTIAYLVGLSYLFFSVVNKWRPDFEPRTWALFSLAIPLSITITLYAEQFLNKFSRLGFQLIGLVLLLSYCYFLPSQFILIYLYQLIILGAVFLLSIFFVSYFKNNNDVNFWEFSKTVIMQLFIAFIFAQVLMIGLSLAVVSLKELFGFNIKDTVFVNLAIVCYNLFAPLYLLANIPDEIDKQRNEYTFNTFLKVLGLYILLPILGIYTLILYGYLGQIIVKWELPNGWVSTLVTVLSLGGFLTMMILYPLQLVDKNKVIKNFTRFFPLILFPLLLLMFIGIYRRFSDYGVTINRGYVLLLNIWLFGICHYLFYSKAKHHKWIVISFTTVLFISSVGPWSVVNVTENILNKQLKELFVKEDMLVNGKIVIDSTKLINQNNERAIQDKIIYLTNNYGNVSIAPFFEKSIDGKTNAEIFEILNLKSEVQPLQFNSVYAELQNGFQLELNGFQSMISVKYNGNDGVLFENDTIKITLKENVVLVENRANSSNNIEISLQPWLDELFVKSKNEHRYKPTLEEMTVNASNCKIVILSVSAQIEPPKTEVTISNLDFNVFINAN